MSSGLKPPDLNHFLFININKLIKDSSVAMEYRAIPNCNAQIVETDNRACIKESRGQKKDCRS